MAPSLKMPLCYRAIDFLNTQMGGAVNKESKEQRSTMSFTKKEMDIYIAKFMNIDRDHKGYITIVDLKRLATLLFVAFFVHCEFSQYIASLPLCSDQMRFQELCG